MFVFNVKLVTGSIDEFIFHNNFSLHFNKTLYLNIKIVTHIYSLWNREFLLNVHLVLHIIWYTITMYERTLILAFDWWLFWCMLRHKYSLVMIKWTSEQEIIKKTAFCCRICNWNWRMWFLFILVICFFITA